MSIGGCLLSPVVEAIQYLSRCPIFLLPYAFAENTLESMSISNGMTRGLPFQSHGVTA